MAGIPKVKIQFDADLDGLKKGSKDAEDQVGGFAGKVEDFGKKAAAAFAVAAAAAVAYAGKLAIEGVKAAIEDEQAQLKLARALETATGATNSQIKAVEDQILKTSLATGVADDQLRPALQRLAIATGDVDKAQKLLNLALDISTATGKPLEAVSNALGKAYEGNTAALAKLNVGISAADAKTLGYTGAVQQLTDLYGGAAAANADTYQGRIDRISVAFNEAKETIGVALLPILDKLLTFVTENILPLFDNFSKALNGENGIVQNFMAVVDYVKDFFEPIIATLKDAFKTIGDTIQEKKKDFEDILVTFKDIWAWVDKYLIPIFKVALVKAIEDAVNKIEIAIKILIPVIKFVLDMIKNQINTFIDLINVAIRAYNLFARLTFRDEVPLIQKIGEISTSGVNLGNRPLGVGMTKGTTKETDTGTVTGVTTGTGISTGGGTKTGAELPPTLIEQVTAENAFKLIPAGIFDPASFRKFDEATQIISNMPTFDPSRFRRNEEMGNTYNININGAIDPIGTAKTISDVLNTAATTTGSFTNLGNSRVFAQ